ncbi:MAG: ATP-binding cassette domain-containing protein [Chloroflexi bacterium]|nr:ATP-binding cassette domain-containing protein [Chloroflexota bacterium]
MHYKNTILRIDKVRKVYGQKTVVKDISFDVYAGEIFAIIGPNGAGKTTTIRMIMDIIKPDSGSVTILGAQMNENAKKHIGYLPEERGLYKKLPMLDTIKYLALLKGLSPGEAERRAEPILKRMGLFEHRYKKIEELSRGMGQFIQFVVTIIHNPDLIILDEPFTGLDPVNAELLKEIIFDLRNNGKAVMLATHQMANVEEIANRVLMINNGEIVLYDELTDIKDKYAIPAVSVQFTGSLQNLQGVRESKEEGENRVRLLLAEGYTSQNILDQLIAREGVVKYFAESKPSLQEIFIKVAGRKTRG